MFHLLRKTACSHRWFRSLRLPLFPRSFSAPRVPSFNSCHRTQGSRPVAFGEPLGPRFVDENTQVPKTLSRGGEPAAFDAMEEGCHGGTHQDATLDVSSGRYPPKFLWQGMVFLKSTCVETSGERSVGERPGQSHVSTAPFRKRPTNYSQLQLHTNCSATLVKPIPGLPWNPRGGRRSACQP